jgi:hypothetical protein
MTPRAKEIVIQTSLSVGVLSERSLRDLYYILFRSEAKRIMSEMEILKNRELAEKVVDSLGASGIHHGPDEGPVANLSAAGVAQTNSRSAEDFNSC